jgi:multidrug efflux pump subunit AcrA (membrane-fusion protein)
MRILKWALFGLVGLGALGLGLAAGGLLGSRPRAGWLSGSAAGSGPEASAETQGPATPVKVIKPRLDPKFQISVRQPCYVEPYFTISLEARVAGPVVKLTKDIGDEVKEGEEILTIDVPDLVADVAKKDEIVQQRRREVEVAKAMTKMAKAEVQIAASATRQKESEVKVAEAEKVFRQQELERFRDLANRGTVTPNIVAERQKYYEAAAAAVISASAAVDKAKADEIGAAAKVEESQADERYKEKLIEVAQRDWEVAKAFLSYATLRAPFDGKVTRRLVHPGSFVQNSATGRGEPLLTIERSDIVTVSVRLPDNYAPFISRQTAVEIEMSEMPNLKIQGRVSRFSPSLITASSDRTMLVEVDLWNSSPDKYEPFVKAAKARGLEGLRGKVLPVLPSLRGPKGPVAEAQLLPGMYGTMRLMLQSFQNAHLIPTGAVFSQGGKPYVFVVKDDVVHEYPVEVQVDDGVLAKVALIETVNGEDVKRDLQDDDVIVLSNQGQLSEGEMVKPTLTDWSGGPSR